MGNLNEARSRAAESLSLSRRVEVMGPASLAYAQAGDIDRAKAMADELERKYPRDTLVNKGAVPLTRAAIEISRDNPARAIEILEQASSIELGDLSIVYTRGRAYLLLHRGREAAEEFQKIVDHPGLTTINPLGALAHVGLARACVLQGDTVKARAEYEYFLNLWKDADPDIPIYQQARAEYAKLQ